MSAAFTISGKDLEAQAQALPPDWARRILHIESASPPAKATIRDEFPGDQSGEYEQAIVTIDRSPEKGEYIVSCECRSDSCPHAPVLWRKLRELTAAKEAITPAAPAATTKLTPEEEDRKRGLGGGGGETETSTKAEDRKPLVPEIVLEDDEEDAPPEEIKETERVPALVAIGSRAEIQTPNSLAVPRLAVDPKELMVMHEEMVQFIKDFFVRDRDYGIIPGTDREVLLKPGAERTNLAHGVIPQFDIIEKTADPDKVTRVFKWISLKSDVPSDEEQDAKKLAMTGRWKKYGNDWVWQELASKEVTGLYRYVISCTLVHRATGGIIATGVGSCSSLESKYASRPNDLENTILKMAKKRSYIDSTLTGYALSDRFTQDAPP